MVRATERWRTLKVTEFERRQITALWQELDQEYDAAIAASPPASHGALPPTYLADLRT